MFRVLFLYLVLHIGACSGTFAQRTLERGEPKGAMVQFFQDGEQLPCNEEERVITMKRASFELRFNLRRYTKQDPSAMRVMFTVNPPDVAALQSDGGGRAGMLDSLYHDAIIDPGGYHYIYYSNDQEKRANLLVERGNHLYLSWPIETWEYEFKSISVTDFKPDNLYASFYTDWNRNQTMEEEELLVFRIYLQD